MKSIFSLIAISLVLALASCGDDDAKTCNTDGVTYTDDISKIIDKGGCAQTGCHDAGSGLGSGSLASYDDAKDFVSKGRILGALRRENGFAAMPRDPDTGDAGPRLDNCDIDKIEAWINAGTPE